MSTEIKVKDSIIKNTDLYEVLKESSIGFVNGLKLLANFETNDGKQVVYVFFKNID